MTHQPPPPAPRSRESASFRHRSSVEITADTTAHEAAEKFLGFLRGPDRSVYEKQAYEIRGTSLFSLTVTFQVLDEEFRFARAVKLSSQGARFSLQATRRSITLKSCLVGRERSSRDHPLDLRSRDVSGDRSPRKFLRPRDLPRDFPRDFPHRSPRTWPSTLRPSLAVRRIVESTEKPPLVFPRCLPGRRNDDRCVPRIRETFLR